MNSVFLVGYVGQDPKEVGNEGFKIVRLSIATNMFKSKEKITYWHDVDCFRMTAEYALKNVRKGDFVAVTGYLASGAYTNKKGEQIRTYNVKVLTLEKSKDRENGNYIEPETDHENDNGEDLPY